MKQKNNYKLIISYDGTNYSGWQVQNNAKSIQGCIQNALSTLTREKTTIIGAGRTDAGVHALNQVAHFHAHQDLDIDQIHHSLNCILPQDIKIKTFEKTNGEFHARYSAKSKIYHYNLWLDKVHDPFEYRYSYYVHTKFDLNLLKEAIPHFIGKKNFTSFANSPNEGNVSKNPVRIIERIDVVEQNGGIRLEFEGNGFLYKMVRNITGTLLAVASGKRLQDEIPQIFETKDRSCADKAAPAHGLFLVNVNY